MHYFQTSSHIFQNIINFILLNFLAGWKSKSRRIHKNNTRKLEKFKKKKDVRSLNYDIVEYGTDHIVKNYSIDRKYSFDEDAEIREISVCQRVNRIPINNKNILKEVVLHQVLEIVMHEKEIQRLRKYVNYEVQFQRKDDENKNNVCKRKLRIMQKQINDLGVECEKIKKEIEYLRKNLVDDLKEIKDCNFKLDESEKARRALEKKRIDDPDEVKIVSKQKIKSKYYLEHSYPFTCCCININSDNVY